MLAFALGQRAERPSAVPPPAPVDASTPAGLAALVCQLRSRVSPICFLARDPPPLVIFPGRVHLTVIDPDGNRHAVRGLVGRTLAETIKSSPELGGSPSELGGLEGAPRVLAATPTRARLKHKLPPPPKKTKNSSLLQGHLRLVGPARQGEGDWSR